MTRVIEVENVLESAGYLKHIPGTCVEEQQERLSCFLSEDEFARPVHDIAGELQGWEIFKVVEE